MGLPRLFPPHYLRTKMSQLCISWVVPEGVLVFFLPMFGLYFLLLFFEVIANLVEERVLREFGRSRTVQSIFVSSRLFLQLAQRWRYSSLLAD